MSKKMFLVLAVIVALMIGGATLTKDKSKKDVKDSNETQLSLSGMTGKSAPDFSLKSQTGQTFTLGNLRGKKVVLFFNEGIMCYPACWNQMAALGTDKKLNNSEVVSLSIVTDKLTEWGSAFTKMPELNEGNILFDTNKAVSRQYGMLTAGSSMHMGSMPGHTYIILDQKGIIRYTLDDSKMGIQNETIIKELLKI